MLIIKIIKFHLNYLYLLLFGSSGSFDSAETATTTPNVSAGGLNATVVDLGLP
jgi:hypothetical protein